MEVGVYSRPLRLLTAGLLVFSRAHLFVLLLAVMLATDPPITPLMLLEFFALFVVLPASAGWGMMRLARAQLAIDDDALVITQRGLRVEVPAAAIAAVTPWRMPVPGPGLAIRLKSGRRLAYGIQVAELPGALRALARIGLCPPDVLAQPSVGYAGARHPARRWYHWVGKFVAFALLPTALLFNVHQRIAYGGLLGEYYLLGLQSYLRTFAIYWSTVIVYLVLYASVWRAAAEVTVGLSAALAPSRVGRVRRVVELVAAVGYYAGVPLLLALRFLE